jgi:HD-GYP domain-containing protein (c-di-GMP phosphodiesterase class II)/DNA-binding CsgD family transcriptional regulator
VFQRTGRIVDFMAHGRDFTREGYQSAVEVARRIAQRLGLGEGVQDALLSVFEQWDGGGMPLGIRGEAIPVASRVVFPSIYAEVSYQAGGIDAALKMLAARSGEAFDPGVVVAFESLAMDKPFWRGLEQESLWQTVLDMTPTPPDYPANDAALEAAALAIADFVDMKSHYLAGHSRRVAELAAATAERLELSPSEVTAIRRAALMHDLGLVAVPSFFLNQPENRLEPQAVESLRAHPRYGASLLSRVPALRHAAALIAAHHEQPDGQGFPEGLGLGAIPAGARIIAVADRFDELSHDRPASPALVPEAALDSMNGLVGTVVDADAFESLSATVRAASRPRGGPDIKELPSGLTDREVEVLRLAAAGLSRREMARTLVVAESTLRHHLESIYRKLDVSTRVAAVLAAMEHGLLK